MTEKEALIFLGADKGDDLQDVFEEQMFQFRQFFTSKPIIGATFRNRLAKLDLLDVATAVLGMSADNNADCSLRPFEPEGLIRHDFIEYQGVKSDWKLKMHRAKSPKEMHGLILQMLDVEFIYSGLWKADGIEMDAVILSKEPDPMALLSEIRHAEEGGIVTFSELAGDLTDRFEPLKKEAKRMFLLHEKEVEWKKSL